MLNHTATRGLRLKLQGVLLSDTLEKTSTLRGYYHTKLVRQIDPNQSIN